MVDVRVKFKGVGSKGCQAATQNITLRAEGKSESAVLAALKKRFPSYTDLVILEYKF